MPNRIGFYRVHSQKLAGMDNDGGKIERNPYNHKLAAEAPPS